jgi:hypothetical protein
MGGFAAAAIAVTWPRTHHNLQLTKANQQLQTFWQIFSSSSSIWWWREKSGKKKLDGKLV